MVRASCPRIPHLTFTYNEDYSLQELRNNCNYYKTNEFNGLRSVNSSIHQKHEGNTTNR